MTEDNPTHYATSLSHDQICNLHSKINTKDTNFCEDLKSLVNMREDVEIKIATDEFAKLKLDYKIKTTLEERKNRTYKIKTTNKDIEDFLDENKLKFKNANYIFEKAVNSFVESKN